jgi:hypothetical protein
LGFEESPANVSRKPGIVVLRIEKPLPLGPELTPGGINFESCSSTLSAIESDVEAC